MSSSDRDRRGIRRGRTGLAMAAALALLAAAGCTVRPLYGDMTASTAPSGATAARLASVGIEPEETRVGQEVRNHLIFLLGGGSGEPANPAYSLELRTSAVNSRAADVNTPKVTLEPTAGVMTVRSRYRLRDARSGEVISEGVRSMQAPYDIPAQEFAALRAIRDAENRAARELAELIRLVIAQELENPTSKAAPVIVSNPEELAKREQGEDADNF